MEKKPNAVAYSRIEIDKLSSIGKAAKAVALCASLNEVSIEEVLPLITALAKKELGK